MALKSKLSTRWKHTSARIPRAMSCSSIRTSLSWFPLTFLCIRKPRFPMLELRRNNKRNNRRITQLKWLLRRRIRWNSLRKSNEETCWSTRRIARTSWRHITPIESERLRVLCQLFRHHHRWWRTIPWNRSTEVAVEDTWAKSCSLLFLRIIRTTQSANPLWISLLLSQNKRESIKNTRNRSI